MQLRRKLQSALNLIPALQLVWKGSPRWTIALVILLVIQGIFPLALLYLTKLVIDTVTHPTASRSFEHLLFLLAIVGGVTLLSTLCNSLSELVRNVQSQRVTDYMQSVVHAKSIEVDLEYYENSDYHDRLQRAQQEAAYRPNQVLTNLVQVSQDSISLVAMAGLLLSLHWQIVVVLLIAAIPATIVRIKFADVIFHWERRRTELKRQATYLSWLMTDGVYAKEIRLFDLGTVFSQRFGRIRHQLYRETLSLETRRTIATLIAQSISTLLMFGAYVYIVYETFQGRLKIGDLVLYYAALQQGQNALRGLLSSISELYRDNLFLTNLYEFLTLKPNIEQAVHPKPVPVPMRSGIVFDRVQFQYGTTSRQAIQEVSLTIAPGEVIALVGENGSGKTTLIKLLCRLYDPTGGKITLDGVDLREYDIPDLRRQISVIFQDYVKYYLPAWENIWLGNAALPPDSDEVRRAADRSGADAVIRSLPNGYDTMLGKLFDDGEELSIGQWQKVALARAFLRESQLIVLDEPTSAMDPKAEYEVFQKFRALIKDQSAILISHRLSTVRMADRIYVMDKGSVIEFGSHDELMAIGGTYAQLFETQAQSYR